MKTVALRDGRRIWALNALEASLLEHEILETQAYAKHGISVAAGDCVFDVGANIGLYSLYLASSHSNVRIFAFEPVPEIFAVLERNIRTHAPSVNIRTLNAGLSSRPGKAIFEFDPNMTLATTMRPADVGASVNRKAGLYDWLEAGVLDLKRIRLLPAGAAALLLKALATPLVRPVAAGALLVPLALAELRKKLSLRRVECALTTVSSVIREYNLDTIHLVKIDVEGSERDVIDGIDEPDWPKIRQFVIEVHDADGRVEAMRHTLQQRGYRTTVDQEDWAIHKLLGIFTLYALREGKMGS